MAVSQQSALQAQITALGERMEQGFNKLESIMTGGEGRVRSLGGAVVAWIASQLLDLIAR